MNIFTNREINERLSSLEGWKFEDGEIRKTFKAATFHRGIAFVVQAAMLAEVADHHPDITIKYDAVTISLMTHASGGITEKDFQLAGKIDQAFKG